MMGNGRWNMMGGRVRFRNEIIRVAKLRLALCQLLPYEKHAEVFCIPISNGLRQFQRELGNPLCMDTAERKAR